MEIPRIIHQTWKSDSIPESLRSYQRRWRTLHPRFEYRLWTDADNDVLVEQHFPHLRALYHSFDRGIFRADLARCLYLAKFGGLYVDLDVEPIRPVDAFLGEHGECFLGSEPLEHARQLWGRERIACNAAMASVPGHPFWERMIEEIERRAAMSKSSDPVWITGPQALDATQRRCGVALGVEVVEPTAFFPLPDLYNRSLRLSRRETLHYRRMVALRKYPSSTVAVHHWAHTWIPSQGTKLAIRGVLDRGRDVRDVLLGQKTIDEVVRPERYGTDFPEAAFPPRPERAPAYARAVDAGRAGARASSVAILVLLRNRLDLALLLRSRLETIAAAFGRSRLYVLGDDSTDGTERVLADWQRTSAELVRSVPAPPLPSAIGPYSRLARLRNTLFDAMASDSPSDFVVVVDGDLEGPISLDGLFHTVALLRDPDGPDAAAAFGVNNWGGIPRLFPFLGYSYYDPLAFRERSFARSDTDAGIRVRLRSLQRGDRPLQVMSAFGGLVVYRREKVGGLRYHEDTDDCEHVSLHRALAERGGKLVVNPSLLLLAGRQGHHMARR